MDARIFTTLSDPTRRRIIAALRRGETTVGRIVEQVGIRQSGVSRHLKILTAAGFVRVRPEEQHRFYSLRPEPFRDLDTWLDQYRALWEARLDHFGRALTARVRSHRSTGGRR
jgi:DNA-binding transcriptional ArsR family regulator